MFYSPHKLYVKRTMQTRDAYNRLIESEPTWNYVCDCRCDDNSTQTIVTENGKEYRPTYAVYCPRNYGITEGDEVRVMDGANIRGHGQVARKMMLNYLDYSILWI